MSASFRPADLLQRGWKLNGPWKVALTLLGGLLLLSMGKRLKSILKRKRRRAAKPGRGKVKIKAKAQAKQSAGQAEQVLSPEQQEEEERARKKAEGKAIKKAHKVEKQMKAWDAKLAAAHETIALVKTAFQQACSDKGLVCVSVDVEAWENDASKVTEIGLAILRFPGYDGVGTTRGDGHLESSHFHHRHILVSEHLGMRNGRFVKDHRDEFIFGNSEVMTLVDATHAVSSEITEADFIIGHAIAGDLEWLRSIGVAGLDGDASGSMHKIVDTQALDMAGELPWAQTPDHVLPQRSLAGLAERYGHDPQRLHNAANDAAFTLQVMLSQCAVSFEAPTRCESNHHTMPFFLQAQAAAEAMLLVSREDCTERERGLHDEVAAFAAILDKQKASTEHIAVEDHVFPPSLSAEDRRFVHKTAKALGLDSYSRGTGDQRHISVCAKGRAPMDTGEPKKSRKSELRS